MADTEKKLFTFIVFTEHCVGLLSQVTSIFTRRCLNMENASASPTSIEGIHRLTITTWSDRESMEKVVKQIEKRVDVLRAFLYTDDDLVFEEIALYKVDTSKLLEDAAIEALIRQHGARILHITKEYAVIEKAGQPKETEALLHDLRQYGVRQFVRSCRVCVTKSPVEHLDLYLEQQELRHQRILRDNDK